MHHRPIYLSIWKLFVEIVWEGSSSHIPFWVLMKIKSEAAKWKWEMCIISDRRLGIWKIGKYIQLWRMTGIRRVTPKIVEVWIKKTWRNSRFNLITSKACWVWYNQWIKMYWHRTSRELEYALQCKAVCKS